MNSVYYCTKCKDKNLLIACKCGCGGIRTLVDKKGRQRHSINGHAGVALEPHKFGIKFKRGNTLGSLSPRIKYSCKRCKDTNFLIECACGCGRILMKRTKSRGSHPREYISGHNGTPFENGNNLGTKFTSETGRKYALIGGFKEGHKPYGAAGKQGEENHAWKGGRIVNTGGYIMIRMPGHRLARGNHYVLEHVLVIEEYWKCCLLPWSNVHHKDENKQNNDWHNLEPMTAWAHTFLHNMKKYGR